MVLVLVDFTHNTQHSKMQRAEIDEQFNETLQRIFDSQKKDVKEVILEGREMLAEDEAAEEEFANDDRMQVRLENKHQNEAPELRRCKVAYEFLAWKLFHIQVEESESSSSTARAQGFFSLCGRGFEEQARLLLEMYCDGLVTY